MVGMDPFNVKGSVWFVYWGKNGLMDGVPIASVNRDTEEGEEEEEQPQHEEEEEEEEWELQLQRDDEGIEQQQAEELVDKNNEHEDIQQEQGGKQEQLHQVKVKEIKKVNEGQEDKEGGDRDNDGSDSDVDTSSNLPTNTVSVAGPTTTPNTDHVNSKYMYTLHC